jgi:hypothetical protein
LGAKNNKKALYFAIEGVFVEGERTGTDAKFAVPTRRKPIFAGSNR